MKTWIIVLNWNGAKRLDIAFDALSRLNGAFELLLVDNGSTDDSVAFAKSLFQGTVHVLLNNQNLGFAEGNNRAMSFAIERGAEFIALINDDLAVEPSWLEKMQDAMDRFPRAAILGGTILFLDKPEIINSSGVAVDFFYRSPDENLNKSYREAELVEANIRAVSGGAMFLRVSCLKKMGMFNPIFFAYFEDVDLCLRAKEHGFEVRRVPQAVSYHKYNGTFSQFQDRRVYLLARNHFYLVRIHAGPIYYFFFAPCFVVYRSLKALWFVLNRQPDLGKAEILGMLHGAFGSFRFQKRPKSF